MPSTNLISPDVKCASPHVSKGGTSNFECTELLPTLRCVVLVFQNIMFALILMVAVGDNGISATTAEINQAVADAMHLKRTCGFLVQNYFGSNTGAMAAWPTAAHVEADPKPNPNKKKDG